MNRLQPRDFQQALRRLEIADDDDALAEAEEVRAGQVRLFSGNRRQVGTPPDWHKNWLCDVTVPGDRHWSEIPDFDFGDIKGVWELNRFSWVYPLVRAWLRTEREDYAETFWRFVEHWAEQNPPNLGPNWKCGQESAIRLFGLSFGLHAFSGARATTPARIALAARIAHATARRIEGHIGYALSQKNNHGISEAAGLLTAGLLWPTLPGAERWVEKGLRYLREQVAELVYPDGGFSQHSSNYHRVLLQDLLWCEAVMRTAGRCLPEEVREAARRATHFLHALMEPCGRVHRYGADDGADLFPLSACAYDDFRPVVATSLKLFCNERLSHGPWDETAFLLFGEMADDKPEADPAGDKSFREAGIHMFRTKNAAAMFRVPEKFRHRPSHADHLHVDLWLDGEPICSDPGSFSYNAPGPLGAGMAEIRFHNTVEIGGREPMDRVGKFLWLPWVKCHLWEHQPGIIQACHDGYARFPSKARHARALLKAGDGFLVVDRLTANLEEDFVLRWHGQSRRNLEKLAISCSAGAAEEWITANEQTGEGWFCERYSERTPSWCRRVTARGRLVFFVTSLGVAAKLGPESIHADGQTFSLSADPGRPVVSVRR